MKGKLSRTIKFVEVELEFKFSSRFPNKTSKCTDFLPFELEAKAYVKENDGNPLKIQNKVSTPTPQNQENVFSCLKATKVISLRLYHPSPLFCFVISGEMTFPAMENKNMKKHLVLPCLPFLWVFLSFYYLLRWFSRWGRHTGGMHHCQGADPYLQPLRLPTQR